MFSDLSDNSKIAPKSVFKIIKEENNMYQTIVSREDMEKLFQNEDNPEVQEKLRKLMEMKSVLE